MQLNFQFIFFQKTNLIKFWTPSGKLAIIPWYTQPKNFAVFPIFLKKTIHIPGENLKTVFCQVNTLLRKNLIKLHVLVSRALISNKACKKFGISIKMRCFGIQQIIFEIFSISVNLTLGSIPSQ